MLPWAAMDVRSIQTVGLGVATMLVGLVILRVASHAKARLDGDNRADRFSQVGEVVAVFLVSGAVAQNSVGGVSFTRDAMVCAAFGLLGLALVVVTGRLSNRALLGGALAAEVGKGNVAAGVAVGAHYVATGLLVSRAVAGSDVRGLGLSVAFFVLAFVTLHLFIALFRAVTAYDDAEEIRGENVAAALSYGGLAISVALLVARALEGDFAGWGVSLRGYGVGVAWVLALYPVRQLVVQSLLLGAPPALRGGRLDTAIAQDRNLGMAALEAATYLATALGIARLA